MADVEQIRVEILATAAEFRTELDSAIKKLAGPGGLKDAIKDIPNEIVTDVILQDAGAHSKLGRLRTKMEELKRVIEDPSSPEVNIAKAEAALELLKRKAAAVKKEMAEKDVAGIGGALSSAGGGVSGVIGNVAGAATSGPGPGGFLGLAGLIPVAIAAGGALTALVGSLGAAALGLGALVTSAAAVTAVGLGPMIGVLIPAIKGITDVTKATTKLTAAQEKYGVGSKQAQQAQHDLNNVIKEAGPGAAEAATALEKFQDAWKEISKPAQGAFFHLLTEGLGALKDLLPTIASIAKTSFEAISKALEPVFKTLSSGTFKQLLLDLGGAFAKLAPPVIQAWANIFIAVLDVARAAAPYVQDVARAFLHLTEGWVHGAANGKALHGTIGGLVAQFKAWWGLITAVGGLLVTIFSAGASSGKGMVESLTAIVREWTKWLNTKAGQDSLKHFFSDAAGLVRELFTALGPVVAAIWQLGVTLMPVFAAALSKLQGIVKTVAGVFKDLTGGIGSSEAAADLLVGVLGVLAAAWAIGKVIAFISALNLVIGVVRALMVVIAANPIGALLVAIGLAASALGLFGGSQDKTKISAENLNGALTKQAEALRTLKGLDNENAQSKLSVEQADTQVKVAKATQDTDRKNHVSKLQQKQDSEAVRQAELTAAKAKEDYAKQLDKSSEAERKGVVTSRETIATTKGRIQTLKDEIKEKTRKHLGDDEAIAKDKDLQKKLAQLKTAEERLGQATKTNNEIIAQTTEDAMKRTGKAVVEGFGVVDRETLTQLKLFAGGATSQAGKTIKDITAGMPTLASGGMIGNEGERGHDEVPIVVGRGEAILHGGHQKVVNQALAHSGMKGGLAEMFKRTGGLHYNMAGGGFAGGGWVRTGATLDPTQGQAPQFSAHGGMSFAELLEAGANAGRRPDLTQLLGEPPSSAGMPMETPILIRKVGGKQAFRIWKNDVGSGQPSAHFTIDLHQAIANAIGWSGNSDVEVAKDGTSPAANVTGAAAGSGGKVAFTKIKVPPWKGPGGQLGEIGHGVLKQVTNAANAKLAEVAPAAPTSGGGGGGPGQTVGGVSGPAGIGTWNGHRVANWIIPELEWARGHGWGGDITSGYRSRAEDIAAGRGSYISEHEGTQYPGGAIDFGGFIDAAGEANKQAFIRATAGYKGKKVFSLIDSFDQGHMSGTGKAMGGFAFARGGFASAGVTPTTAKAARAPRKSQGAHTAAKKKSESEATKAPKTPGVKPIKRSASLPADVIAASLQIHAAEVAAQERADEYTHLTDAQALVPTEALGTLTAADVATMDPGGKTDSAGVFKPGPKGYIAGDELVNEHGMTTGRFYGPAGIQGGKFVAGIDTRQAQILELLSSLHRREGSLGTEETVDGEMVRREQTGIVNRQDREKRIKAYLVKQVKRAKHVKKELDDLKTGDAKKALANALSAQSTHGRTAALKEHLAALTTEHKVETKHQSGLIAIDKDPGFAESLSQQMAGTRAALTAESTAATHKGDAKAVAAARERILKDSLQRQLGELSHDNSRLGGDALAVGSTGLIGKIASQVTAMRGDQDKNNEDLRKLPAMKYELSQSVGALVREQIALNATSAIQVRDPEAKSSEPDAQLLELVKQQLAESQHALAVSQSQFAVFAGFEPLFQARMVGTFAHGVDRVPRTGPAMVHQGEVILPDPDGPYGNRAAAQVNGANAQPMQITLVMANNDHALMRVVDARVDQRSLRVVSDKSGQRSRLIAGVTTLPG